MTDFYDQLETRSADQRMADQSGELVRILSAVTAAPEGWREVAKSVRSAEDLPRLPLLRKSELAQWQVARPPFGGIAVSNAAHIFQSPGPIYEPGGISHDWWRVGRFLHAAGVGRDDIVQNCFSYHMTPAGMIFESGARAVGATVFPAGTGQTDMQVRAARDIAATAYAGTPDYLKVILDKADEIGVKLRISKATVGGGALFPSLRAEYADRGIRCLQNYATADLGNVAYESPAMEGMIVDEGVILEIVRPGTGDPVPEGEVGEVVVTSLNPDYSLVRFATGDLSAFMPGVSPCGRTNRRIKGWMGRADQTAKIKGMFLRPEQVAALLERHPEIVRARVTITRDQEQDQMLVQLEADAADVAAVESSIAAVFRLKGRVELVSPGSLPNDGKVIDDKRDFGS